MAKVDMELNVNSDDLEQAQKVFHKLGLTIDEGINIYLKKVGEVRGIPFSLILPPELQEEVKDSKSSEHGETK